MLDTQIAKMESQHGQTTSTSSNPLNLGESRWEEEENTEGFHGEASKPEGEDSRSSWRREADGNGGSGAGEAPGGDLGEAAASLGRRRVGVNEGNRLGCPHLDPLTQGENR
jgi:hypothetical protein